MSFLDRLRGVPAWAGGFSLAEYAQFRKLLREELRKRALPTRIDGGTIAFGAPRTEVHFETLARKCKLVPQAEWEGLVVEYLAIASRAGGTADWAYDFELARTCLKVQLMDAAVRRVNWEDGLNFRSFAADLLAVLVFDSPESVDSVMPEHVRAWKQPGEWLFQLAAENVQAEPGLAAVESERCDAGCTIHRLTGDSFFVATQALWIERFAQAQAERGVLVSVPSRHVLQFSAIRDASATAALQVLALSGVTLFNDMPGPLSPGLFWIRNGNVAPVPVVKHQSGQVEVKAPPELMAALS